ncbi:hypothetical protein JCM3770_005688, partial [Rhodotorula araucariae]
MLPPPPPRHPSSRSPQPPPRGQPPVPPRPRSASSEADRQNDQEYAPSHVQPAASPLAAVPAAAESSSGSTASSQAPPSASAPPGDESRAVPAPPRHPSSARLSSPLASSSLSAPSTPPPPRRQGAADTAVERKLRELEDLETLDLLERVSDQLTDVRVAGEDVMYPDREQFRTSEGKLDWVGYATAYLATAAHDYTPSGLIAPPPSSSFSFRALRGDLERLYVICPPPVWQRLLLGSFASLWRWQNPRRTGIWVAVYLLLWCRDALLLFPFAYLLYHILYARFFPPSVDELLAQAADRRARSRDAAELSKQLNASSRFGVLGGGVRGLWSEVRDRLGREEGDEKSLAAALGSSAALGGMAGGAGGEPLRRRADSFVTSSTPPPPSTLSRAFGSSAGVLGAAGAPVQTTFEPLRPSEGASAQTDGEEPGYDHAGAGGAEGELSLYRLVRHLAGLWGPQAMLWCAEAADVCEMVKNVALRLALMCTVLLVTPAWIVYKTAWLWVGTEVFLLWFVRELYPEWRRATIPYWWLLVGAPTDVEYALWVLRQRNLTQRPLRGSKTLRRSSRAATAPEEQGKRATATRAGTALLRRAKGGKGEEMLLASGESEAVLG